MRILWVAKIKSLMYVYRRTYALVSVCFYYATDHVGPIQPT